MVYSSQTLVVFTLLFIVWGTDLIPSHIMDSFKFGTINLNGAKEAAKRAARYETARMKKIDCSYKRPHRDENNKVDWYREWRGEAILSHCNSCSAGVGFLFSTTFNPKYIETEHVVQGRCLLIRAGFKHFTVVFINIHDKTFFFFF